MVEVKGTTVKNDFKNICIGSLKMHVKDIAKIK